MEVVKYVVRRGRISSANIKSTESDTEIVVQINCRNSRNVVDIGINYTTINWREAMIAVPAII